MTPNPSQSIEVFVDADFCGDAPIEETEEQDGSNKWKHASKNRKDRSRSNNKKTERVGMDRDERN